MHTGTATATDEGRRHGTITRGTAGTTMTRGTGAARTTTAGIRPGTMAGIILGTMAVAGTEVTAGMVVAGMEAAATPRVLLHVVLLITQVARLVSVRDRGLLRRVAPSGLVHSRQVLAVPVRRLVAAAVQAAVAAHSAAVVAAVAVQPAADALTVVRGKR